MGDERAEFGDAALVSPELKPTIDKQRTLTFGREAALWAALAALPSVRDSGLLGGLVVGVAALAVGLLLTRGAGRYGVGLTPIVRAALGPRGAPLFLFARWALGCAVLGRALADLAQRGGALARVAAPHLELPVVPAGLAHWGAAALFALVVGAASARGLRGVRRVMRVAAPVGLASALALLFLLDVVAGGFGSVGMSPWGPMAGSALSEGPWAEVLLVALAAPEWARFRNAGAGVARRWPTALSALASGAGLALVAWLVARVAGGALGAGLTTNAAAAGGIAAACLAYAVEAACFVIAASLLGVYAGALALCGVVPALRYRRAEPLTVLGVVVGCVVPFPPWAFAVVLPFVGVLVADEWLVRGGRVVLEELYLARREAGLIAGVRTSGLLAWLVGAVVGASVSTLAGGLAAALVYWPLARLTSSAGWRVRPPPEVASSRPDVASSALDASVKPRKKKKERSGGWAEGPPLSDETWHEPEDDDPTAR